LAAAVATCLGCGRSGDRPETAPVDGTVTYRGQPVAGATVSFLAEGAPRAAIGRTDERGRYRLTTFDHEDGAVLGPHVVTVYKSQGSENIAGPDPTLDRDAYLAAMDRAAQQAIAAEQAGSALPAKYADPKTSDLRAEVHEGENDIPLELVD
jgi:hypothetical protein